MKAFNSHCKATTYYLWFKKKWKFNPDCINSEIPEIHTDDITGRMKQKNSNVYKCILIHVLKEKK